MSNNTLMQNYARLAVSFVRGEGALLWDDQDKEYLDALGGIAVCSLGHCHPKVTHSIQQQAATLLHTSNIYGIPKQQALANKLTEISGLSNAFFCNSGAEANEAAIKLARLHGHKKGITAPAIIVMDNSFHGRTLATLSATGNRKVQAGFEPLVQGFIRAPFNDIEALNVIAQNNTDVVAIFVEPIQGEGGIQIPSTDYLNQIRKLCDDNDWLMILDEIQTGIGRTGKWFAFQHNNILPDIVTIAKSLGNGIPIGACLAGENAKDLFQPGNHGSTFGGNPFACSTALTVLESIEQEDLINKAKQTGQNLLDGFNHRLARCDAVKEIRGLGMMIGIELNQNCSSLVKLALEQGLLINVTREKVIRLLPPFIITESQTKQIIDIISNLIEQHFTASTAA